MKALSLAWDHARVLGLRVALGLKRRRRAVIACALGKEDLSAQCDAPSRHVSTSRRALDPLLPAHEAPVMTAPVYLIRREQFVD